MTDTLVWVVWVAAHHGMSHERTQLCVERQKGTLSIAHKFLEKGLHMYVLYKTVDLHLTHEFMLRYWSTSKKPYTHRCLINFTEMTVLIMIL